MQRELGITFVHVTHTQLEAIALADKVVVMAQGRIEQAASARDIFVSPRNAHVARFIGGQNVIGARVVQIAGDDAVLTTAGGARLRVPDGAARLSPGKDVHVAVRRDRLALRRSHREVTEDDGNKLAGMVESIEYQGSYVKLGVDVGSSEEFVAQVSDELFFSSPLAIGAPVWLRWDARDTVLLEDGLERAKAVSVVGQPRMEPLFRVATAAQA